MPWISAIIINLIWPQVQLSKNTYSLADLSLIAAWEDLEVRLEASVAHYLLIFLLVPWLPKDDILADRRILKKISYSVSGDFFRGQ
jgi:hypothetical protein